ncbi:hypothetical protein PRVXT_001942 [Proteinivorax tanatarense]|uniref:Uncharacterized protein n=1 Tax=Proteinivorax tanatarense TaxID=1260629 RepID=A0AAU7VIU3_9FIRM
MSLMYSSSDGKINIILPDNHQNNDVQNLVDNISLTKNKDAAEKGTCASPAQVGFQYKCGSSIKKALAYGGQPGLEYKFKYDFFHKCRLVLDYVRIVGAKFIEVQTYIGEKQVGRQVMQSLKVSGQYHCLGETGIVQVDHKIKRNTIFGKKAYQIECGNFCKKILNVDFIFDGGPLLSLFPPSGESIIVKTYGPKGIIHEQCVEQALVERNKVVSFEEGVLDFQYF